MPTSSTQTSIARLTSDDQEKLDLVRRTYARDLNPTEFELLRAEAEHRGLSVVNKELIAVKFRGNITNFVTLSGLRRLAERSGDVRGVEGPYWRGKTGPWTDAWLEDGPPAAAKFLVYRRDAELPYVGIAIWKERKQEFNGKLSETWAKMPAHMLAKVAETDAYKRARVVSETESVSYDGDETNAAPEPSVRVTEAKAKAMAHAHAIAGHEQIKQTVRAINPGAGESLTDDSVTAADIRDAAAAVEEFGEDAATLVAEGPDDYDDTGFTGSAGPSLRELWRAELRDAFAEWNKETAAYIRAELDEKGQHDPTMWADAVELAPSATVRDRFINAALEQGIDARVLEAGEKARADTTQVKRAADAADEEFRS